MARADDAMIDGFLAGRAGKWPGDNPYRYLDEELRVRWHEGWTFGRRCGHAANDDPEPAPEPAPLQAGAAQ